MREEKAMFTTRKIALFASVILSTALALTTTAAFANAPGGAYIQCDGVNRLPSDAYPIAGNRVPNPLYRFLFGKARRRCALGLINTKLANSIIEAVVPAFRD
jgi:hypothetical protein